MRTRQFRILREVSPTPFQVAAIAADVGMRAQECHEQHITLEGVWR